MVVRIIIIAGAVNKQANGTSTSDPLQHPSSAPMDSFTVLFQRDGPRSINVELSVQSFLKWDLI